MQNCTYYAPTEVVFGKNTESQTGALIRKWGGSRSSSTTAVPAQKNPAFSTGLPPLLLRKISPSFFWAALYPIPASQKSAKASNWDAGNRLTLYWQWAAESVIDSAKAIGYGLSNEGDVWDFYTKKRTPSACLPLGAVLTIAAAGSEMSDSSVITNEEGWLKRGCSSNFCRCRFAVMNPELTCTLPPYQTASGCTDILMHTMERYFTNDKRMDLTDELAEDFSVLSSEMPAF